MLFRFVINNIIIDIIIIIIINVVINIEFIFLPWIGIYTRIVK